MRIYPILSFIVILLFGCNSRNERIQPVELDLTESVYASATVQPDSLYKVYAAVNGILDEIYVEEGDTVSRGQRLMKIVNTNPSLTTENAKLAYELAQSNFSGSTGLLKSLREEIESAKLKLSNDSISYFRQKNLWEQKIGSKAEYDNRKLAYDISRRTLTRLENDYARTRNELQTQVEQAQNQYKSSLVTFGDFTIKSKLDGTVYALNKNPGELVSSLEPIASVGCTNNFLIELLVDEVDVVKIEVGQQVIVTLDAYEDRAFEAVVSKILPEKDFRNQTFTIEAAFVNPPDRLYPGLSGEANVVVAEKEKVLAIPTSYLVNGTSVETENGPVEIVTGLRNLDYVEVVSGLSKEDYILKPE